MTAHTTAEAVRETGAPSNDDLRWYAIDWRKAHHIVRRLQMRIVKATQQGRWGKVKALQHLLTHSLSGKALAVKRVTENPGHRTPGVDKVVWNTPHQKMAAITSLRQRGYHPQPLRRVYIPKSNGKLRSLGIPCMKDRAMQALYLLALDPIAETTADPNSYGFRKERCPADAIEQCFNALAKKYSAQWILEGDIKACFDEISHDWLLTHIPMDTAMLKKWLKAGYMEKHVLHPTTEGTPQGGCISPVIANMTLDGLERRLRDSTRITGKENPTVCKHRSTSSALLMILSSLERAKNSYNGTSSPWSSSSCTNVGYDSPKRRPASLILRKASNFLAKRFGSTTAYC